MKNNIILVMCPPFWTKTPPVGMAALRSYLESFSFSVELLDLNIHLFNAVLPYQEHWQRRDDDFEKGLFDILLKACPDEIEKAVGHINDSSAEYVGFSLFSRNLDFSLKFINMLAPSKKVILGGPEVFYESFDDFASIKAGLNREVDYLVVGEGEKAFLDILEGRAREVTEFAQVRELDELPLYDFTGFDLAAYKKPFTAPLLSSRGCIGKCSFCAERMLYKGYRRHSAGYVIEQIKHIIKTHDTKVFSFQDSLFNENTDWVLEFADRVLEEGLDIHWDCQMMIRKGMNSGFFKKIKKAGCFNIFFGIENGSDKVLRAMKKPFCTDTALGVFAAAKEADMHFEISLIIGYPGESEEDFQATYDFLKKNKSLIPKIAQVNPYVDLVPTQLGPADVSAQTAQERIERLVEMFETEGVRYTKAFINNLIGKR